LKNKDKKKNKVLYLYKDIIEKDYLITTNLWKRKNKMKQQQQSREGGTKNKKKSKGNKIKLLHPSKLNGNISKS